MQRELPYAAGLMYGAANICRVDHKDQKYAEEERQMRAVYLEVAEECQEAADLAPPPSMRNTTTEDFTRLNLFLSKVHLALVQAANLTNNIFPRLHGQEEMITVYVKFRNRFDAALRVDLFSYLGRTCCNIKKRGGRKK